MEAYKKEFIEFMIDCEVLKFGDFVTKSGRVDPFFVKYRILPHRNPAAPSWRILRKGYPEYLRYGF